ncbi:MAG: hypothetical protein AAFR16_03395 [Pseudomonadota bacterium]
MIEGARRGGRFGPAAAVVACLGATGCAGFEGGGLRAMLGGEPVAAGAGAPSAGGAAPTLAPAPRPKAVSRAARQASRDGAQTAEAAAEPEPQPEAAATPAAFAGVRVAAEEGAGSASGPDYVDGVHRARFPKRIGCDTVQLMDSRMRRPSKSAPAEWRAYHGHWGDGAWDGKLCHGLVVEEVRADGTATVVETQGWYRRWNRWPRAVRRPAKFLDDGRLEVDLGDSGVLRYRLEQGVLYGIYSWDQSRLFVTLHPRDAPR